MSTDARSSSFSLARVLLLVIPIALLAYGARKYSDTLEQSAEAAMHLTTAAQLLGSQEGFAALGNEYADKDGDLVADPPTDESKLVDPDEIIFSYFASNDDLSKEEAWKEVTDALSKELGKPVKVAVYADHEEQRRAMKNGELHIAAFGTGDVPSAVNDAGFVPLVCFADKDGAHSISMKIIVPADSDIEKPEDLKGRRMTFVRPRSNSGCTAAAVVLMDKYGLQPDRDYRWGFSYGHDASIDGIADKSFEAAAVASDILDRRIASGDVEADKIRTIYESDKFPPGVIGVIYDLKPELTEKIRDTLVNFQWEGTEFAKTFGKSGSAKFAAVDYKKDWAPVRQINDTSEELLSGMRTASR